jgi:hypothetical protein
MPSDDRLKQYQEAGAEFIEAARAKAEEFLRGLGAMGESTTRQASSTGRRGADQILEMIRSEIAAQLAGLGLATKADLAELEHRLTRPAAPAPAARKPAAKKAATPTAAAARRTTTTASKAAGPAKKTTGRARTSPSGS